MKTKLLIIAFSSIVLNGCSDNGESPTTKGPEALMEQAGMRVLAPAPGPDSATPLYHKIGPDGIVFVTPMNDQSPAKVALGKGEHDVSLVQDSCKWIVDVTSTPTGGAPEKASLSMQGTKEFRFSGSDSGERIIELKMASGAADNFGCNVMVRHRL